MLHFAIKTGEDKLRLLFKNGELRELSPYTETPELDSLGMRLRWRNGDVLSAKEAYMRSWHLLPTDPLWRLIDRIQHAHVQFTDEWTTYAGTPWNLNKKLVRDLADNADFQAYVREYLRCLQERDFNLFACDTTSRVKTCNSVLYKLSKYMAPQYSNGKIPLNKCLNDLMGFRVILPAPTNAENYAGYNRCIDSSKGQYKAMHIYFNLSNNAFPWELQIWNRQDQQANLESHRLYKQQYLVWERSSDVAHT